MIEGEDLHLFERSLRQATERHTAEALDAALADLGWLDALGADPRSAVSLLFSLQGEANVTSSALQQVLAAGLGVEPDRASSLVLPASGSWNPPGELSGDRLSVHGLATSAIRAGDSAVVVGRAPDGAVTTVTVALDRLTLRSVNGLDPSFHLVEVTGEAVTEGAAGTGDEPGSWDAAVSMAQLAAGHELVGAARGMLRLAREHALDRIQFGQPIARFQAVRHRLAETLVAIESAEAVLDAAWEFPSPELSSSAKALAGRGARTAARHCQQVLAGIGFTAEHPFHRYLRRVLVLDQLFGSARSLTEELGRELLAGRRLPALLPL